jgi:ribonuclease III
MVTTEQNALESLLGHHFHSSELLERALTHSSWVAEHPAKEGAPEPEDNEKLEFLGDAVLTLVVSEALLSAFPEWHEGRLSKARATLVNAGALAHAARRLDLGGYLRLGRGEEKTGGREKAALLADAFEAVIAAIYLDSGLDAARGFIEKSLLAFGLSEETERLGKPDHKSHLQEILQERGWPAASYRVVAESGPDHRKVFEVEGKVHGHASARGQGNTKKEAEQAAAREVIAQLAVADASGKESNGGRSTDR